MSRCVYIIARHVFMYLEISRQWLDMSKQCLVMSFECQGMLPMAPLHSLGNIDQNKVKRELFGHVMQSEPASLSCDANCIVNGIILFIRWRQLKQVLYDSCSCDVNTSASITWHWWYCQWYHILFVRSRWLTVVATYLIWSCDANTGITYQWCHHQ